MSRVLMKLREGAPTEIKVEGVPGQTCHAVSKPFEAIAGKIVSTTPTPEAGQPAIVSETVSQPINT